MLATLFIFALVTAHAMEIPSYIRVCGRSDPNYDQCIVDNLNAVKYKICTGMPEFNVGPTEPIIIDKIVIYDTDSLKLYLRDAKLSGYCDFVVNSVHTDPDRLHFVIDITIKHFNMNVLYDFDIHVLVPLANKGLAIITSDNVLFKLTLDFKVATKNGEKQIYVSKANTNINITSFKYEFDESEKELVQLHQAISNVVDSNSEDIIRSVKSAAEKKISELVILVVNNITRSNYEKLFPEKV
ncbi:PREDICTED: uncharacterized protein LOC105568603 [Vollenhovia emeryi]|uniref:uncharacterized protein LOC105568603 n=1 Tax=Vollenhovia emeryi TaxID=411798 RepID=UPI0005F5667F|nr:PREDICTED: uncharacterized protein LOC105568603 [Vollenhovia emeryi]